MNNNVYYIPENVIQVNNAGSKAREDIDVVLKDHGLKPLLTLDFELLSKRSAKLQFAYWYFLYSLYTISNKWVILQYPVYGGKIIKRGFEHLINNNNLIFIIHDLEYLRFKNTKRESDYEISLLNKAAIIVSHNSFMTKRMRQDGVNVPIVELELFDYLLNNAVPTPNRNLGRQVVFAGNLAKSDFLKNEAIQNMDFELNLYGPGFNDHEMGWKNIHYAGSYKPNEVPYKLEGSFGLIWDGTSIETCDGKTGEYMRYNNPHKLSLYIIAGLPVVVWKDAAIAQLVDKYQIGMSVGSLDEFSDKIQSISIEKYEKMVSNIKRLQIKLANGYFVKEALLKIDDIIFKIKNKNS